MNSPPSLRDVLSALADDIRLEIVRRLATATDDQPCGVLYEGIAKSTASYHFTLLRDAGLIEQYQRNGRKMNRLRQAEIEALAPGLLAAVVTAATNRSP